MFGTPSLSDSKVLRPFPPFLMILMMLAAARAPAWWYTATVDTTANVGNSCKIAIDSNDRPHIAYQRESDNTLKYAFWNGSSWVKATVATAGTAFGDVSFALDSTNRPHIVSHTGSYLNYSYKAANGTWSTSTVDSDSQSGSILSLAVDSANRPHIAYRTEGTNNSARLRYAYWNGANWIKEDIDSRRYKFVSMAIDSSNKPHIAGNYSVSGIGSYTTVLKYWSKTGTTWVGEDVDLVSDTIAPYPSTGEWAHLIFDASEKPRIAHWRGDPDDSDLIISAKPGSEWLEAGVTAGAYRSSLSFVNYAFQRYAIGYRSDTGDLIRASKVLLSDWGFSTVASGEVIGSTSMAYDSQSMAHFAYEGDGHLRYARYTQAPALAWTGLPDYVSDGLNPESGTPGSTGFYYRIKYSDTEGELPKSGYPKVHILKGGVDIGGSPVTMTVVEGSGNHTVGITYMYFRPSLLPGEDYSYYFEAYDTWDAPAVGPPTTPLTGPSVPNTAPTLEWAGSAGYSNDGLEPESGSTTDLYTYRIKYTDADGDIPTAGYPKVRIFREAQEIAGSPAIMFFEAGGPMAGSVYYCPVVLPDEGEYTYSFLALDKWGASSNEPEGSGPSVSQAPPSNLWMILGNNSKESELRKELVVRPSGSILRAR